MISFIMNTRLHQPFSAREKGQVQCPSPCHAGSVTLDILGCYVAVGKFLDEFDNCSKACKQTRCIDLLKWALSALGTIKMCGIRKFICWESRGHHNNIKSATFRFTEDAFRNILFPRSSKGGSFASAQTNNAASPARSLRVN